MKDFLNKKIEFAETKKDPTSVCSSCGSDWRARLRNQGCVFCRRTEGRSPIEYVDRELTPEECAQNELVREWIRLDAERDEWFKAQNSIHGVKPFPKEERYKELCR